MSYPRLLAVVASILLGIGTCLCWYLEGTKPQVVNAASPQGPSNVRVVPGSAGYVGQAPKGSAYRSNGSRHRIGQAVPRTAARLPFVLKPGGGAPAAALTPTAPAIGTGAVTPSEG
jgi:hypothetical protein